jgi:hypothetical protein
VAGDELIFFGGQEAKSAIRDVLRVSASETSSLHPKDITNVVPFAFVDAAL